jgi:branched-chain amino acid transport system ATP-binding protein
VEKGASREMSFLVCENITKSFGGLTAVSKVSFQIERGGIVGLIGPNGAGKTTLFSLINGFYSLDQGSVLFLDEPIHQLKPNKICKKGIGRTFQIAKPFSNLTILQNVRMGAYNATHKMAIAEENALEVIHFVDLGEKKDQLAKNLTIEDRKRLELARALATKPKLLLLDEVMAGLNPTEIEVVALLIREINKKGVTIFLIEHVMKAIMPLSDRIIVLHHGEKITEGTPLEISKNPKVIEAYLGEEYQFA